jgi:hypothetical protein
MQLVYKKWYFDQIIHLIHMSNIPQQKPITQMQFSNVLETLLPGLVRHEHQIRLLSKELEMRTKLIT